MNTWVSYDFPSSPKVMGVLQQLTKLMHGFILSSAEGKLLLQSTIR